MFDTNNLIGSIKTNGWSICGDDLEMDLMPLINDFKHRMSITEIDEYIHDIKSGAILLCEEFLKKGVLIHDNDRECSV